MSDAAWWGGLSWGFERIYGVENIFLFIYMYTHIHNVFMFRYVTCIHTCMHAYIHSYIHSSIHAYVHMYMNMPSLVEKFREACRRYARRNFSSASARVHEKGWCSRHHS